MAGNVCAQILKGDVDGDGKITINDANAAVNIYLGSEKAESYSLGEALKALRFSGSMIQEGVRTDFYSGQQLPPPVPFSVKATIAGSPSYASEANAKPLGVGENSPAVTAVIDNGGTDGSHPFYWSAGDKLGVYYTSQPIEGPALEPMTLSTGAGTANGTFTGDIHYSGCSNMALHPYQEGTTYADGVISNVYLKTEQNATPNTCDPECALMTGLASSGDVTATSISNMEFRNVVSYLRVKAKFDCKSITIVSNVPTEYLTGLVEIGYQDGVPVYKPEKESGNTLALNKVVLKGNIQKGETYYIAVLPVTLTAGIKIIFETCEKTLTYNSSSTITTLYRNNYHDFTSLLPSSIVDIHGDYDVAFVDLGLPSGTLWCNHNLGASHSYDTGKYYAWGEIAAQGETDTDNQWNIARYNTPSKMMFTWETYKYNVNGSNIGYDRQGMSKYASYCTKPEDQKTQLDPEDDAAQVTECNGVMPTKDQFEELIAECDWEYTENYMDKGVKGFKVSNKSDASKFIFLPFTGFYQNGMIINENSTHGYYWSRDVSPDSEGGYGKDCYLQAWDLVIGNDTGAGKEYAHIHRDNRRGGQCIRPVDKVWNKPQPQQ